MAEDSPEPTSAAQKAFERRQKRLVNGGANRLARITKTFHPELYESTDASSSVDSASSNDVSSTSPAPRTALADSVSASSITDYDDFDPPISELPEHYGKTAGFGDMTFGQGVGSDPDNPFQDDPLFKLLNEMKTSSGGAFDPFSAMLGAGGAPGFGSAIDGGPPMLGTPIGPAAGAVDANNLFWNLVHVILVVIAVFTGKSLLWTFCTVEIILHTTRFIADKGQISNSFIATIANYVGPPYGTYLRMSARYLRILGGVYHDVGVLLFVYILVWGVKAI